MQKNLVIVESPAKAKTIEKFLGDEYKVLSSYGHIRDLKKKEFSIDIDHGFTPVYEIPKEKKKLVEELMAEAAKAQTVWLASDEDREGEAISWHLFEVLGLSAENTRRIVFHEITKPAILAAIAHPRGIDINLVNAQQARRVLDRIVGFELSPVLWRKVKPALSAGRVQSVAVRLIVEREREIAAFVTESAFRVSALLDDGNGVTFRAVLSRRLPTQQQALQVLEKCRQARFVVTDVQKRPVKKSPPAPFTTSTLQQEAARRLGFTVAQTMILAQHLYENGYITYMRTDSVNLSDMAIEACRNLVEDRMGPGYASPRKYTTHTRGAQEAHEAIRPTDMEVLRVEGTAQEARLYELIWKRTLASQMADASMEKTTLTIEASGLEEGFTATGEVVVFDGFLRIYKEEIDEETPEGESEIAPADQPLLPAVSRGHLLSFRSLTAVQRFSQAPPRYTEAGLVRRLEELGIGRPSTYAPTISTVQQRGYVLKGNSTGVPRQYEVITLQDGCITSEMRTENTGAEKGKLLPTDVGMVVNDFLMQYFPGIMDYNFTAGVEKEFDEIACGHMPWTSVLQRFYEGFHPLVEQTLSAKMPHKVGERILGTDPQSGRPVSVKIGRYGPVVQIGSAEDELKPRFAQMRKGQSLETITLEEALELFCLPRDLGELDGHPVTVGHGRFGPYVHCNGVYVSVPAGTDPLQLDLDGAMELIEKHRRDEEKKVIKTFEQNPDMMVLNGRYGPYIAYKGKNYKIPENIEPADLNLEACFKVMELQQNKAEARKARYRGRKGKA